MDRLAGIWQTVWIEPVASTFIRSFRQTPKIDHGQLLIEMDTVGAGRDCSIAATVLSSGTEVSLKEIRCGEPLVLDVPDVKLWSPKSPFLYDLTLELKRDGKIIDRIESYFGMRKIEVGEVDGAPCFLLNNELSLQVGLLDQPFWPESWVTAPSDEAMRWEIEKAKEMGFNVLRKHFKVEAARWYYWCDKLGMLVWQDLPPQPYFRGPPHETEEDKDFQRKAMAKMITQLCNHPSIIMWVIFNESFGQFDPQDMTNRARRLDSTRLINTCSHVIPKRNKGPRYSEDVYDMHRYGRTLGLNDDYDGRMPSVFGEFGGIAYRIDGHIAKADRYFGYGDDATSPDDLLFHYEDLVRQACALREPHNVNAIIYTQITDVGGELNGFITCDRKVVKVDPEQLQRINNLFLNPAPAAPIPMPAMRRMAMPKSCGRFVRVELPGPYHLVAVTEIEVFEGGTNVALKQAASASSVRLGNTADRAVDGIINESSVAMTDIGISPWIEIDLKREVAIDQIRAYNLKGQAGKRLDHVVVRVLDSKRKEVFVAEPVHAAAILEYGVNVE
jgi:hypothetical protein